MDALLRPVDRIRTSRILHRPLVNAMRDASDGRQFLALYAKLGRELFDRLGPLLPTILAEASGDPQVRAFVDTGEQERAVGTREIARLLHERFGLRPGLTVDDAAAILWTLTAPEPALRLVHRRGWSPDRYKAWLADTMALTLLPALPADNTPQ
jgi:hypothetical protein